MVCAVLLTMLAGCAERTVESPTASIDPVQLVTILPTADGLDFASSRVRTASAADVQEAFAGRANPETATKFAEELRYRDGAIRTWTGADGAAMTVVVSRWPSHQTATNTGGGAAEFPIASGAAAWTPKDFPGARGSRSPTARSLAFAIADISLFVRTEGPIGDDVALRTLARLSKPVLAVAGPRR